MYVLIDGNIVHTNAKQYHSYGQAYFALHDETPYGFRVLQEFMHAGRRCFIAAKSDDRETTFNGYVELIDEPNLYGKGVASVHVTADRDDMPGPMAGLRVAGFCDCDTPELARDNVEAMAEAIVYG